jgi:hypothetical protein
MLAPLIPWARSDDRMARRLDRAAERDDDADLTAYDAMPAEPARRETPGPTHQPAVIHSRGFLHRDTARGSVAADSVGGSGCNGSRNGR